MSSSPRTRPTSGRSWPSAPSVAPDRARSSRRGPWRRPAQGRPGLRDRALPAGRGDRRRAPRSATCTTIVFLIAAAIFLLVEGLIIWTVIRYRRKPGDDDASGPDPRQQPRRARLDGRPDDHRRLPVRHLVADAQRASTRLPPTRRPRSGPSPASSSGSSTTSTTTARPSLLHRRSCRDRRRRRHGRPGRPDDPADAAQPRTSSTPSTSRSSCSSATSSRAGPTSSTSGQRGRRRPDVPRPVRRAVRHRPPDRCSSTSTPLTAGRLRRLARSDQVAKANATPDRRRPSGEPRRRRPLDTSSALNVAFEQTDARRRRPATPFAIDFDNKDAGIPHNVAIHQGLADRRRRSSRATIFNGPADADLRRARPRRRHRTPSSARSIRT